MVLFVTSPTPNHPPVPNSEPVRREDVTLQRIAAILGSGSPAPGEVFIGDDAAVLSPAVASLVVSTDVAVAGVHLDLDLFTPSDLGFKAVMSAVSDVAAMGGVIRYLLIAVTAPAGSDLDALHQGISEAAHDVGASVVGGDLSTGPALQVAVTVIGEAPASGALLRSGAAAGDFLFVTGPLGRAAAGLRRRREGVDASDELVRAQSRPVARLAQGMAAARAGVSAAMDLSDGVAIDLHRLADASSVGFELTHLPVATGASEREALSGGEDYELLIATSDPEALRREFEISQLPAPVEIGRVIDEGQRTLNGRALPREGWQHEF